MIEYAEIYDSTTFKLLGVVDVFKSFIWHTCYYSTGDFEIYCQETESNVNLLKMGRWITIPNDDNVAIIESIQTTYTAQDGRMLVVTGRMATSVLERRIIYKRYGTSYIVNPTIINGNVQKAIAQLIDESFINPIDSQRKWESLITEIASSSDAVLTNDDGIPAQRQVTYDNLLEYVEKLLQEYSLGARAIIKDYKICYQQYVGKNVPIIFSTEFDNLVSSEYTESDTEYRNVGLVAGEEQTEEQENEDGTTTEKKWRQTTLIYGTQFSGFDRREVYIDGSSISRTYEDDNGEEQEYTDAEYQSLLRSFGKNELAGMKKIKSLTGAINVTTAGIDIRDDYNLGDLVTIQDRKLNVYSESRILEATEVQDENGYSIDLVYGE